MKARLKFSALLMLVFLSANTQAQKIKTVEGDLSALKNETSINIEFTYDNMSVGKYDKEADYVSAKTAEYNKKEPGKGDSWAASWVSDRAGRYQPKFILLFEEESKMKVQADAKYTMIFKTASIEPGYNVYVSRKNASVDADVWIVETADKTKKIAVLRVDNAPGRTFGGYDFDTGLMVSEAFEAAGKKLGKYIK